MPSKSIYVYVETNTGDNERHKGWSYSKRPDSNIATEIVSFEIGAENNSKLEKYLYEWI